VICLVLFFSSESAVFLSLTFFVSKFLGFRIFQVFSLFFFRVCVREKKRERKRRKRKVMSPAAAQQQQQQQRATTATKQKKELVDLECDDEFEEINEEGARVVRF